MIEIELPDGSIAEFPDGTADATIESALSQFRTPQTNLLEQTGSGTSEGVAGLLGAPVDIATSVLNLVPKGINAVTGSNIPPITDPVGGSGTMRSLLSPFISETEPQTGAQRFGRRVGQEVGFGLPAAMIGGAVSPTARANLPSFLATNTAGDVGAGVAGQTSQEIAPGNATADLMASLLGGLGSAGAASRLTPKTTPVGTLDDLKAGAKNKFQSVEASGTELTPEAQKTLNAQLQDTLVKERATNTSLFPRANATLDDIATNPNAALSGIEENRRLIGRNVAANADEAGVGVALKKRTDDFLSGLRAKDVTGGNSPEQAVKDLLEGRKKVHQAKKAEAVINKALRGESRAATSGTGGNEVNATRQNIRALLDKERDVTLRGKKQGLTPDEMSAMEKVVMGTSGSNTARNIGKLSPSSNGLASLTTGLGGVAGVGGAVATGNPLLAVPAAAGGIGAIAKHTAESLTKSQIDELMAVILNGGTAPAQSASRSAANRAMLQQLISRSAEKNNQ